MLNLFNPSSRNSDKLERHCSHCNKSFICDGSCENPKILEARDFCYCPICWDKFFWSKHNPDRNRSKCSLLEKYLTASGREKDFKALGEEY